MNLQSAMKTKTVRFPASTAARSPIAFTLIELLVVIAIMAILAGLVLPIGAAIKKKRIVSKSQTELQQIASAIEAYKAKLGVYPPDNPNNINLNQLYYELVGTTLNNAVYTTKDGASTIAASAVPTTFGLSVGGFVNCTQGAGSDEGTMAQTYIRELKPNQIADISGTKVLGQRGVAFRSARRSASHTSRRCKRTEPVALRACCSNQ